MARRSANLQKSTAGKGSALGAGREDLLEVGAGGGRLGSGVGWGLGVVCLFICCHQNVIPQGRALSVWFAVVLRDQEILRRVCRTNEYAYSRLLRNACLIKLT